MPLFFKCPSSALRTDDHVDINPDSIPSLTGSAVHELLAWVVRKAMTLPLEAVFGKYPEVDREEVLRLLANGKWIWADIAPHLCDVQAEVKLKDPYRGTADVIGWSDGKLVVVDWKSGRRMDKDHEPQLLAYAASALKASGREDVSSVQIVVGWLQDRTYVVGEYTIDELAGYQERVEELKRDAEKNRYGPGDHCTDCDRKHDCTARDAWMQSSVRALAPLEQATLSRADLVRLYPQSQALGKALEQYKKALRLALEDGPLPLEDEPGKALKLVPTSRQSVNASAALEVFENYGVDAVRVLQGTSLSKADIGRLVKKDELADVLDRLENEGLMDRYDFLQVKKVNAA